MNEQVHCEFLTFLQKGLCRQKVSAPYGCPENFRDSLATPTATFPKIFHGLSSDWPYECAYKI